ncbi:hypothetical protein EBI01_19110 [Marinomonas rhizomae]|uniref:Teichuronopeptide biosynthesis TupA-like protein n=1 Tax=Marinomonas rhizomae TaxID=491948 RepID=A0A366J8N8_9GAMM|nr:ATP-grasp fold amidoligase family protein [Marinomonas rhizomae]RBP83247.1 teichuronopeptide biosynthesis TupA-like protein [Marinomonas rhizomae]RNF69412.1 hypothetical protein EBI01_19110 [Marinomonas rhizomae]
MIKILKRLFLEILILVDRTLYFKITFYKRSNYWPNINFPRTINENILKLKIESPECYSVYADKVLVREIVENAIFEHNLNKLKLPVMLFYSDDVEDFLRKFKGEESFVKANHGSGMCFYFDGKTQNKLTPSQIKMMREWLCTDYYKFSGEACYKNINRKVFAEKPLRCKDGSLPDDIKVHCYFGKPAVIQILRRTTGKLERKTYDENWIERPWFKNEVLSPDLSLIPKEEVLLYAKTLSTGFEYVRVDFYLVDGLLYFSELTFYPASASLPLTSKKIDEELGAKYREFRNGGDTV